VELCSTSPWVEKMPSIGQPLGEKNLFDYEFIGKLQKRNLDFARSEAIVKEWNRHCSTPGSDWESRVGSVVDDDRRKVDLRNKVVLAPLTTVGNLPFRRLCIGLGCEVTVGEMALASTILEGKPAELALLRRHESETCFGVQVAGGDVETMTKVAQFIDENVDCDFVDINSGCPLDELHRRGSGSRLMSRVKHMEGIVRGMSSVLKTKPLTLKMRTAHIQEHGQKADDPQGRCAHKLVPLLEEWGVGAITIHGRTARQRYSKFADWNYISECASRRKKMVPLIGGGDILNWEDVEEHRSKHGVDSFMIGRGALIKPWLFTEIKEKRHWDISASERFDMLRNFTNYGLDHWGSDARGVETTRRFLLEWLSFTCRYVPIGLLEQMPPKLNWRPRTYIGRSDMETKLGSQQSNDWVTISEMLLGPVPEGFTFVPKHKSKAYDTSEGQQSQTEQG
jgi:tRNA-dihydrouridine synthase 3